MILPKNGSMKNGHLKVHTQSTVKYSYPPSGKLYYYYVCIVDYVRYWKRLPDNILKLKELFLLGSFHMLQVFSIFDHFIVPFSSIGFW